MLLAGLGSFLAGWFLVEKEPQPGLPDSQLLLVRPVDAVVTAVGAREADRRGEWTLPLTTRSAEVTREGWPEQDSDWKSEVSVRTARLQAPGAKLKVRTENKSAVLLKTLPSKEPVKLEKGYYRLVPGHHEFLAEADGHIPDRLSVDLKPGQTSELTVKLKAIPVPQLPPIPQTPSAPPQATTTGNRPPPRHTTSQPPAWVPPARPMPKFTPVPSRPKPPVERPVPLFTPVP